MISILKKLVYIIIFSGVYYVFERYLKIQTGFTYVSFSYAQPVLNSVSIIAGPLVGAFASAIGELLVFQSLDMAPNWVSAGCIFLYCGSIGLAMRNVNIKQGSFRKNDIMLFNHSHFFSGLVFWVILYPLLNRFFYHANFWEIFKTGLGRACGFWIMNFVTGTLLLSLFAKSRISAENFYGS